LKIDLEKQGDKRYEYMDSDRVCVPSIVDEKDHFRTVAEFKGNNKEGYDIVYKLNRHKLLVDEVNMLSDTLLKIYEMIPIEKIQHNDPDKDELLYEISNLIAEVYYGTSD